MNNKWPDRMKGKNNQRIKVGSKARTKERQDKRQGKNEKERKIMEKEKNKKVCTSSKCYSSHLTAIFSKNY